ncbi:MAG TPA: pyridoxal phosphate-dependent aminotransferase [Clostridiales bacterium]|nr:pyridoxal phosphate-dependent aminotransferase [Clostridiales bacterium]
MNEKAYELGAKRSEIRELYEYGVKRKAEIGEKNVFDFSLGNPAAPAPEEVKEEIIKLLERDPVAVHGYTSAAGDITVRRAIADYINGKFAAKEKAELIYLTCGAAAALSAAIGGILKRGEEIIVFAPFFPEYKVFIENAGGSVKIVPCGKDFIPDAEILRKEITENTRAAIINSPNNPTGAVIPEKRLKEIAAVLKEKSEEYSSPVYLIADEPYRDVVYDGVSVPFPTKYYDDTIVCYSFSKSLSLPGERIGYAIVGSKCRDAEKVFLSLAGSARAQGYVCAPALFQKIIPALLGKTADISVYKENRDILLNGLKETGYEVVKPDGAFYLFVKALEKDAKAFSERAKKYELLVVPSDSFGVEGYVRIATCVSRETAVNSLSAFRKLYGDYKNERT